MGSPTDPSLLAPDATLEGPGLPGQVRGQDAITRFFGAMHRALNQPILVIETAFESADRAVLAMSLHGIHVVRLFGVEPSGESIDLDLMVLAHVHHGQIRHLRLSFDRLALRHPTHRSRTA